MAAFCTCCGAAITSKSERCAICGAPMHGMAGASPIAAADALPQEAVPAACRNTIGGCKHLPAAKSHLNA